jgi:signal transduction histidine kinase
VAENTEEASQLAPCQTGSIVDQSEFATSAYQKADNTLADFIRENTEQIIREWEAFAKSLPPAEKMTKSMLRDHVHEILTFIARDMDTYQSEAQQIIKSQGNKDKNTSPLDRAAEIYGALRLESGFDIVQMVSEYRALRASVIKLWTKQSKGIHEDQIPDLIRFNEAIDQALAESVSRFTKDLDASKNLFLGILGHDLRNPVGAIVMSAQLIKLKGPLNEIQAALAAQIEDSASRVSEMVTDLLDLTRARLGAGIPVEKQQINFDEVVQKIVEETRAHHIEQAISLGSTGRTEGQGDPARIKQVVSNLLGNAIQYGRKNALIIVSLSRSADGIILSVHNQGTPIPASAINTIFDSLVRGPDGDIDKRRNSTSLGLGLYIAKMIVLAHGGELSVISTEADGTTFTATFPY